MGAPTSAEITPPFPPVVVGLKFIYGLLLVADQQLALASCNIIYIGRTLVSDPS
jgi:hypothetical protein